MYIHLFYHVCITILFINLKTSTRVGYREIKRFTIIVLQSFDAFDRHTNIVLIYTYIFVCVEIYIMYRKGRHYHCCTPNFGASDG